MGADQDLAARRHGSVNRVLLSGRGVDRMVVGYPVYVLANLIRANLLG